MSKWLIPLLYLIVVLICLLIAFDFQGSMRSSTAWLVAVGLTLPWSIVSVLFMWALFHGAGLEFFTVIYMAFALINAYLFHRLLRVKGSTWKRLLYGNGGLSGNGE